MSTPVGSSQWMYTPASGFYPYLIDQSLRFNDNDSAYLSWTPASAGNRKTWTWSCWVKRSSIDSTNAYILFDASTSDTAAALIEFGKSTEGDNSLNVVSYQGAHNIRLRTSMRFRDVSSWYHIVVAMDTSQATASDRVNIYVNGTLQTDFQIETYPAQNHEPYFNSTNQHHISKWWDSRRFFDGYMAEVNFIDGTALDATSFGETINGIWVPKQYSGSYGTNGFYLSFADSAAIGDDLSGNTNDWTATNLAASDVVPDSPTNNFATFNPLDISGTTLTYSEGNLKAERTTTSFAQAYSSFSFDSGKWYAEFLLDTGNTGVGVIAGTTNPAANRYIGQDTYTYGFHYDGRKVNSASYTAYGSAYTRAADGSGDVVGVYIDADNGDIYFSVNGTVQNSGTAAFTGVTGPFRFAIGSESNAFHIANFGQDDSFAGLKTSGSAAASDDNGNGVFYDAIGLSGYLAPCTANLPEPAIGPNSDTTSDQHFNTVLWTGDGASSRAITGVGHAPDFVWIKTRNQANEHSLFDSVRGVAKDLESNSTAAEQANNVYGYINSFDSDGFTVDAGTSGTHLVNYSGNTYAAWNWKAGGTAVSNTDGSITTSVSTNADAGISIIKYTGNNTSGATIGHNLGVTPDHIIIKRYSTAEAWVNWHKGFTATQYLRLYQNISVDTATTLFNSTLPSSSVITLGNGGFVNTLGEDYICYAFAEKEGFSKFGSMELNNNADGTFVYLGFRPALVIAKRIDGTGDWNIFDSTRDAFNDGDLDLLQANTSTAESSFAVSPIDLLSNGFKLRHTSSNGYVNTATDTAIYLAFAEAPAKYSNAR